MLKLETLMNTGFHLTYFPLSEDIRNSVRQEKWQEVDEAFQKLTAREGRLSQFLKAFHEFESIEFIISIRDAENDWEEDGIWHDDGSRIFAFSLSLTENAGLIEGGRLGVKRKSDIEYLEIPTPEFGGIILFLTGLYGFEHKIHRVTKGRRIIIAGWCS
jgi:hypothetical protein